MINIISTQQLRETLCEKSQTKCEPKKIKSTKKIICKTCMRIKKNKKTKTNVLATLCETSQRMVRNIPHQIYSVAIVSTLNKIKNKIKTKL